MYSNMSISRQAAAAAAASTVECQTKSLVAGAAATFGDSFPEQQCLRLVASPATAPTPAAALSLSHALALIFLEGSKS